MYCFTYIYVMNNTCCCRHLVAQEIRREQEKAVSQMVIDGNASDGDMPDDTDDPNELLVCFTIGYSTLDL
jgi:hypothetical protein